MSATERRKGANGEREVVGLLRKHGFQTARRTSPLQAHRELIEVALPTADVGDEALTELHLEVKRQERIEIEKWCRQAETDAGLYAQEEGSGLIPVVVWRRSRQPWRVTFHLDAMLDLFAELIGLRRRVKDLEHEVATLKWRTDSMTEDH